MKSTKPTELTNEELIKNEKTIKTLAFSLAVLLLILFASALFLTIKKGFTALIVTPLGLLPILIILFNNWNEHKKEIKARNL